MRPLRAALRLSILVALGSTCALGSSGAPPVEVDTPPVALAGIRATVTLTASCGVTDTGIPVRVVHGDELLGAAVLAPCGEETIRFVPRGTGLRTLEVRSDEYAEAVPVAIRVVPGWWSLAPRPWCCRCCGPVASAPRLVPPHTRSPRLSAPIWPDSAWAALSLRCWPIGCRPRGWLLPRC